MYETDEMKKVTMEIFAGDGEWSRICFSKDQKVALYNLPSHLKDVKWLAKLLKTYESLKDVNMCNLLYYVSTSDFFQNMRHLYELKIVRWQISSMLNDGDGYLVPCKYDSEWFFGEKDIDLAFRESVVLTLTAIGMDKEVIEEGLEKYADLWRDKMMLRAFYNQNHLRGYITEDPSKEYQDAWLKLREYEYYENHRDSVNRYGKVTEAMQMNFEEKMALQKIVKKYLEQRRKSEPISFHLSLSKD